MDMNIIIYGVMGGLAGCGVYSVGMAIYFRGKTVAYREILGALQEIVKEIEKKGEEDEN